MRQTIVYEVPDKYTGQTGWRKTRNRIALFAIIVLVPATVVIDRLRKVKCKSTFWEECAARWLYLSICTRLN